MAELFLLCEYPTLCGAERSMLAVLDAVRTSGFQPAVIAPAQGSLAETLRARDIEVIPFCWRDAGGTRPPQDRLRRQLAELLRRRRPDLLDANSLATGRLSGPVARELGLASIAHLREIIKLSRQAVADLNRHARLLAVSRATRDFHVAGGMAGEKTHVLYNGVDLQKFRPRPPTGYLHRELGLAADAPLVGTIGQISLRKAQDVFVRAAALLAGRLPRVHFVVVGRRFSQKDESRRFETDLRAAATGDLAGRLHFLGNRNNVERLLGELTLLAHPARQEPLGRVLLEAAACGVPVAASAVGGTPEIFPASPRCARLVPPDDPHALAAAIIELLADGSLRARMGTAARRRAEETFNVHEAAARLIEHYRSVISKSRST